MNKTTILTSGSYLKNGKYLIEDSIGQGSFGITYLATTKMAVMGELGAMQVKAKVGLDKDLHTMISIIRKIAVYLVLPGAVLHFLAIRDYQETSWSR